MNALESVVPNAEHRFCVMHLFNNMQNVHKGQALRTLLWLAARSTTEWEFNKHMTKMKEVTINTSYSNLSLFTQVYNIRCFFM